MSQAKNCEMKASGVEWIGPMPSHWSAKRLKYVARSLAKGNGITKDETFVDGDTPCIRYGEIYTRYNQSFTECVTRTNKDIISSPRYFSHGDILFTCTGELVEEIGKSVAYLGSEECMAGGDIIVLKHTQNASFLNYALNCNYAQAQKSCDKAKLKVVHISAFDIGNIILAFPPLSEQTAIAAYLDEKCATIDAIVTEAKATIDEYKAWKASVIFETVTKGLNPNAEMKDSGVEWIGEIPKGWKVKAAKYCVEIHHGSDPVTEGDVPVYGSGADSFKTCGEYKEGPAVLVGRKGATLHIPHYIIGRYWNVDTAFDVKAHPGFSLKFYYYLAICFDYKFYISQTTLPGMTQTNYRNMPIPVPPLSEQASIVSYLDRKCSLIDGIILEKEELIRELENYKRSLIFEAVTGKRRVC